jgi:bacterioferritin-associated ferredoxin
MIVCSCRIVCTNKIKECMKRIPDPTVQKVIKELNWTPECATCAKSIVKEITAVMEQKK